MKTVVSIIAVGITLIAGSAAQAQPEVGTNMTGGLPWSVAADANTTWRLECRFRPITSRGVYQNRMVHEGRGPQRGNLPTDNGRCTLTRLTGTGNIGLAVIKNGQAFAKGSTGQTPAILNVF